MNEWQSHKDPEMYTQELSEYLGGYIYPIQETHYNWCVAYIGIVPGNYPAILEGKAAALWEVKQTILEGKAPTLEEAKQAVRVAVTRYAEELLLNCGHYQRSNNALVGDMPDLLD